MSNFISELNKAYKSVLLEQPIPGYGEPAGAGIPPMNAAGAASPVPPMPTAGGTPSPQELPVDDKNDVRSSSDAFLIGMIAKALLIDVDSDDKLKIVKYLKNLDEESATNIEENLVNIINNYGYQEMEEEVDVNIPPKKSRKVIKFLNSIMKEYVDTDSSKTVKS